MSSSSSFTSTGSSGSLSSRGSAQDKGSPKDVGSLEEASGSGVQGNRVDAGRRLAVEIAEDNLPRRAGYDWVSHQVTRHFFKYRWSLMVESYSATYHIFAEGIPEGVLSIERCSAVDTVCHRQECHGSDFFFIYAYLFTDSHIRVPFNEFTMGVLRTLNVAPTQLHSNPRPLLWLSAS